MTQAVLSARDGYNAIAGSYDDWGWQKIWAALETPMIREALDHDRDRFSPRVLDIGVGTGRSLERIAALYPNAELTGIDVSESMLAIARARLGTNVTLLQHDARRLPFESSTFSLVLLCRVASHIENLPRLLAEATRVVLPEGTILASDLHPYHNYEGTHRHTVDGVINIETHKHMPEDWARAASMVGLKTVFSRIVTGNDIAALPNVDLPQSVTVSARPVSFMMTLQKL